MLGFQQIAGDVFGDFTRNQLHRACKYFPLRIEPGYVQHTCTHTFTDSQLLAILALAEPLLRRAGTGAWQVPTAVQAARRLGWTQTRFNRKLDNVCDKLDRVGVRGLKGGPGRQALGRRAALAEYAVNTRIVTAELLPSLDAEAALNARKDAER